MAFKYFMMIPAVAVLLTTAGCGGGNIPSIPAEKQRAIANELFNRELYPQAIEEYRIYLDKYNISDEVRANILYTIGNIYFERVRDYENALAYFLRVKNLFPESPVIGDVNKQIIASLERMDRSVDARQALREASSLDKSQVPDNKPGEVVAMIGERTVTQGDLDFEINRALKRLPQQMRPKEITAEQKLEYLREFLTIELLYNTATRKGLDKDKEVLEGTFEAKKMLMASVLRQQEIEDKVNITNADIELYFNNHKDEFAEKDDEGKVKKYKTLQEVQSEVAQKVQELKQQQVMDDLLLRIMKAENVQIFQEKVK